MISAQVLSGTTLTLGWLGYVPLLIWAASQVRWVELFTDRRRQHLLFGTVFCLFALWLVRRDFDTGVSYHFIGMTAGAARLTTGAKDCFIATALSGTTRCVSADAGVTATASDAAPISTVMRTIKDNLLMALSYRPLGANQRSWS